MRIAIMLLVCACGSSAPKTVEIPTSEGGEDCTSSIEDAKPGNADRFAFEADDGKHGYKNAKGEVVIPPTLSFAYEFKPAGIAGVVTGDGHFAFIDPSGNEVARAYAFDNGPDYFQEGHARIVDGAGKIGFISQSGRIAIAPAFDRADSFCHGAARVERDGRTYFIDKRGVETAEPNGTLGDGSEE